MKKLFEWKDEEPKKYNLSYNEAVELVDNNPYVIRAIPYDLLDQKICDLANSKAKYVFRSIPNKFITQDMCMKAIEMNVCNITLVPNEFRTYEMYEKAINNISLLGEVREIFSKLKNDIPKGILTQELCEELFEKDIIFFEYMPDEFKTLDICLRATENCQSLMDYVPEHLLEEVYNIKLDKGDYYIFPDIDEKYKTYDICVKAVKANPINIKYVPHKFIDDNIFNLFLDNFHLFPDIDGLPSEIITYDMCKKAVLNDPDQIYSVPKTLLDKEMIENCQRYEEDSEGDW